MSRSAKMKGNKNSINKFFLQKQTNKRTYSNGIRTMYTAFEMQMERCQREMLFNYFIFLLVNWIELKIRSNFDDYMQISISCFEMVWWIFALRCRKIPSSFFSFCYNSTCNKQLKVFSEINHESCDNRSNYHWKLYVYV